MSHRRLLLAAAVMVAPESVSGQERCTLQIDNVDRQGIAVETTEGTNYFAGGNVRLSCRGTRIRMRSDSVAAYAGNVVHFLGRVHYEDSSLVMDADRGTYYRASERWEARGRVRTRNLKSGSTLEGPSLDYFRVVQGVRDTAEMYAVSRPRIEYISKDSTGQAAEPYVIVADRVRTRGDDLLWAGGNVTIAFPQAPGANVTFTYASGTPATHGALDPAGHGTFHATNATFTIQVTHQGATWTRKAFVVDGTPIELATLLLDPASPRDDGYNHLSVRAAAAITFDRLLGG